MRCTLMMTTTAITITVTIIVDLAHSRRSISAISKINLVMTQISNSCLNVSKEGFHEKKTETIAAQRVQRQIGIHEIIRVC